MKTFNQYFESNSEREIVKDFKNLVAYFIKENEKYLDKTTLAYDFSEIEDKFGNLHASIKSPTLTLNQDQMYLEYYDELLNSRKNMINDVDGFLSKFYNKFELIPFVNIEETNDKGTLVFITIEQAELESNKELINFLKSDKTINKYKL